MLIKSFVVLYYINKRKLKMKIIPKCLREYYPDMTLKSENYIFDNKLWNEDGPASTTYYENGQVRLSIYLIRSKKHREDGPAYISYCPDGKKYVEKYFIDGEVHREDGPAYISYNSGDSSIYHQAYYIEGKEVNNDEWLEFTRLKKLEMI